MVMTVRCRKTPRIFGVIVTRNNRKLERNSFQRENIDIDRITVADWQSIDKGGNSYFYFRDGNCIVAIIDCCAILTITDQTSSTCQLVRFFSGKLWSILISIKSIKIFMLLGWNFL